MKPEMIWLTAHVFKDASHLGWTITSSNASARTCGICRQHLAFMKCTADFTENCLSVSHLRSTTS